MKERLITLGCALGALALFLTIFGRSESAADARRDIPRPTSEERRGNGYHAAMSWLDQERTHTASLRNRFDRLADQPGLAPAGNLLIVTLPASVGFRTEEFRPLERWVRAGNTLLVLAALADSPDWAISPGRLASGDLTLLTGLQFERVGNTRVSDPVARMAAAGRGLARAQRGALVPNRPHAYLDGVREAVGLSDYPWRAWTVQVPYDGFVLSLAHSRETGEGALWTRPLGSGRIIVSTFGSLFTNRALGLADNARLLANIVGTTVGPKGVVLFDDAHQGLGAGYDPAKFYRDRRLYATVGILAGLWLAWVLGSTRLRMSVRRGPVPREAELVRATGRFLARVLRSDAGARRMFEHFFRRIGEQTSLSRETSAPPWEVLERHPRIARADLQQLKGWYADACAARRVPLTRLHNLIVKIDSHLDQPRH